MSTADESTRHRRTEEDNTKIGIQGTECEDSDLLEGDAVPFG